MAKNETDCPEDEKLSKEDKEHYGNMEGKYRAESDVRALLESAQIRKDDKRYEAAKYCMRQKEKEIKTALKDGE